MDDMKIKLSEPETPELIKAVKELPKGAKIAIIYFEKLLSARDETKAAS